MRNPPRVAALAIALLAGGVARAEEVKLPQTAAEHLAMSKSYQEKATAWRAEAAYHRDMAREYTKAHPDRKSGARNSWAWRWRSTAPRW